jgi:Zn-dependent peptidase ImmA (M78 family)/DNA-binding XRE family transcriptional regulator
MEDPSVNKEMVALARESRGMTQSELARALAVRQSTISKIEAGTLHPDQSTAHKLSAALGYPHDFFTQDGQIRWNGSGCMYHRKRQSVGIGEYKTLVARVNVIRLALARLLDGVQIETENKFFRMDAHDSGRPASIAEMVRHAWNLPPGPVENLTTAIESAGGIVIKCDFGSAKLDAFSQWPPGFPPLFFVNRAAPPDRYRFTLAHEVGHIIMHVVPTEDLEREADEFAAEFLMPRQAILRHFSDGMTLERAAAMKPIWRVSMAAILRRAKDLKAITDARYRRLVTMMSGMGYRKVEPVAIAEESPEVVNSILRVHQDVHGWTPAELAGAARMVPEEFWRIFMPPQPSQRPHLRSVK